MIINYSDQDVIHSDKSIFLAGPTPRDKENIVSWRKRACNYLEEKGFDGVVYVPECSDWEAKFDYLDQVSWEREALENASIIAFWIPRKIPELPGFTTNVEFGYWLHKGNVLYGRPSYSKKTKYLDWLYELDYGIKPYDNIELLLDEEVNRVNSNNFSIVKKKVN